jgi:hypothetical protein
MNQFRMNRSILVCALFAAASAALVAQTSQPNPYAGTSNPPPDETITDSTPPPQPPPAAAKPPAAHYAQPAAPVQPQGAPAQFEPQRAAGDAMNAAGQGNDDGIVQVAPDTNFAPNARGLNERAAMDDPDGDIVHPGPPPPGQLGEGTQIRVHLLDRLSTAENHSGDAFHTRVASDVFRGNEVLIPAGAEIDGTVVQVSSGHTGGHGSMLLRPETVILPDGSHYRLYAQTTGTPGSKTRVGAEGNITPGSRLKKDGIEYGSAVGAGLVTGAIVAGPPGALAGTLIGAGAITVHLLVDHPQATLESGTTLMFTLTESLNLMPASQSTPTARATPEAQPAGNEPISQAEPAQAGPAAQADPASQN